MRDVYPSILNISCSADGGFVSERAVVSTMMMSFAALAVISVIWSLFTYSLAFSSNPESGVDAWMGAGHFGLFHSADRVRAGTDIPEHAFMMFQLMFAVISAAVVSGSVVGRMTLWGWTCFVILWHIIVYVPLARWIFYPGGWLAAWGVLDFAGGLPVETASGVSAFVLAYWVGPSVHFANDTPGPSPHNIPFILIGAGLLFFGWFGFNAGSALVSGYLSSRAFANTHLAASAACCGWAGAEWSFGDWLHGGKLFKGKVSAVGAAEGLIVGLVVITPACGFVSQMSAILMGFLTACAVFFAAHYVKKSTGVDDSLDCFAGHGLSGMAGILWTGLLASKTEGSPADGAFLGNPTLLGKQTVGLLVTIAVCIVGTTVAYWATVLIARLLDVSVKVDAQAGSDVNVDDLLHGDKAYAFSRPRGWTAVLLGHTGGGSGEYSQMRP